ncbi:RNA pyrophosphohydrolase [Campylobacter jejuni]|uniref:RNA pyrophosphohydrolase n=3 Tax=Campylobacter jejuni TaxID=197 RepID=RPPH_CAMJD|nr:RecName: Full=RNA pyrophosphohydrolase; AltName: Full=(Di)nucleoside polyphosphate hydrolase [Campylobacter jejuni subsp. doylei 269.97]AVL47417.1 RNA pyrophosphohydrolase [Campylobacter jejuni subsp. doylei]EAJ0057007.1 RNA pyrophosphohydrolase [Campylobacter jejuni]ABS44569.1 (di)nucleoside polyphosphate hydrolase [Campylobacter jejuni subsp. doylei 269.97]EAJ7530221.1 RNA pyrophosphohydrolase [Campylobacter jejuni]EAL7595260.1 RNA pyrophosphohydrolase [Campylobacter jejuni]
MENEKNYRPNVAAIVLSSSYPFECKIFIAKRSDMDNIWQFPQGGIDKGESAKNALFRELKEEIGTDEVEIIAEYPEWLSYDFPGKIVKKMYPYDGQIQKYFLVRLKHGATININTKHPEFDDYQFVSVKQIFEMINHFKKNIYVKVIKYFEEKGYI